jgi:hypothetical protein
MVEDQESSVLENVPHSQEASIDKMTGKDITVNGHRLVSHEDGTTCTSRREETHGVLSTEYPVVEEKESMSVLEDPEHSQALISTTNMTNFIDLSSSPVITRTVPTSTNVTTIIIDLEESPECPNISKFSSPEHTKNTIFFLQRGRSMSKKRIEILSSVAQRSSDLKVLPSFNVECAPDYIIADASISVDQLSAGLGFTSAQAMANKVDLVSTFFVTTIFDSAILLRPCLPS